MRRTPAEFGAAFEDVVFPSRGGVKLSGWFVPAQPMDTPTPGCVILCHGMSANRQEVLSWAAPLWERGFALLMFDFRALGRSGGDRCTAGYYESKDLQGAVDYLLTRPDVQGLPIGVFGFSMGGAAAIMAAAEDPRIQAVATHGAFATLEGAITQRYRHHFGPLGPLAKWLALRVGRRWLPMPLSEVAPVKSVARLTPRPLLLIHGSRDRIVRPTDAKALHAAAGHPKSLRVLPRSGHKRIHRHLRPAIQRRVAQFFISHLQPEHAMTNTEHRTAPPALHVRAPQTPPYRDSTLR